MIIFILDRELNRQCRTRYWLSKETGIDNNTLAKIYNNKAQQIRLETLDKICFALRCKISDIIEHDPSSINVEGQMSLFELNKKE